MKKRMKNLLVAAVAVAMVFGSTLGVMAAGECEHNDYFVKRSLAATCESNGFTQYECNVCQQRWMVTIEASTVAHDFVNGSCTVCGAVGQEAQECEHNYVVVKELPATCIETGYVWEECSLCGDERNYEVGEPTGSHGETRLDIVEANCVKTGVEKVICKDCGAVISETTLPVNDNHAFHNGTCLLCGKAEVCEHADTYIDRYESTCAKAGYEKVICKDCDEVLSEEVLPLSDEHVYRDGACLVCGKAEACEHTNTYIDRYESTCAKAGYEKVICKDCDEVLTEEVLPLSDEHVYRDGVCLLCEAEEGCDHDMVLVKELAPTCVEAGYAWYECSKCGHELNHEVGEPTGEHDYVVVKELEATCVEAGYVWKECSVCGAEKNHEVGEPTGEHDYVVVKELEATCVEAGYVWKECSVCGAEKNHEVGEPTGEHDYVVVKELEATCVEAGYVWKECSVCGAEKNHEVGEPTGEHDYVVVKELEPTCVEAGYVWKECSVCGAEKNHEVGEPTGEHDLDENGECSSCDYKEVQEPEVPEVEEPEVEEPEVEEPEVEVNWISKLIKKMSSFFKGFGRRF